MRLSQELIDAGKVLRLDVGTSPGCATEVRLRADGYYEVKHLTHLPGTPPLNMDDVVAFQDWLNAVFWIASGRGQLATLGDNWREVEP